jgi:Flp pilus assembly protein TadG
MQWRTARDDGQSLMEFAFLLPVLLLLAVGVVELGRAAAFTIAVNNAATAGAEWGSQNEANAQNFSLMETKAMDDANSFINFGKNWTATATNGCVCDDGTGVSCNPVTGWTACSLIACTGTVVECVQVTTQGTWNSFLNFPGVPQSYQANGQAVMRVQR